MPAIHTLHAALTRPSVQHVHDQVAAERHLTTSDALQFLMERDAGQWQAPPKVDRQAIRHG